MQGRSAQSSAAERGRSVYVSEGCIHCHSQYSRPGSADETMWGPHREVEDVLSGEPVLIGNRRQGPDLTNVGARRSEAWLKAHFLNPRMFASDSPMPSYAHLFADGRGDELVRYLKEAGVGSTGKLIEQASQWKPVGTRDDHDGRTLYVSLCAVCHGVEGIGNGPLSNRFIRLPANLQTGTFIWTHAGEDLDFRLARMVKF